MPRSVYLLRTLLNCGQVVPRTYFLWLSVSVMPCEDTLKCTTVAAGGEAAASVSDMALATACGPVRDSISTELM